MKTLKNLFKKATGKSEATGNEMAESANALEKTAATIDKAQNAAEKAKKIGKFAGAAKDIGTLAKVTKKEGNPETHKARGKEFEKSLKK